MKNYKKILCGALAAAMVLTTAAVPASAAAKPALNKTKLTMTVGDTATLKVKNAAKKEKITWASKKKTVAAVSSKGKVTAKKAGKTVVSATLKKAGKTLKCNVTVKAAETPAPQTQDITALLAGKSYKGTAEAMGTQMDALKLTFGTDGTVTGEMLDTETLAMKQIGGTYTATLEGKTVTVTVTAPDGTVVTETLTVVKDDYSELSATKNVMGMDIPVTVVEVTE
ncbi:MAG: Ig domain-containing protein [Lachnospiraceae bacterium]|nr:Ig-like domain-containing protein [Eubacterium sp.]